MRRIQLSCNQSIDFKSLLVEHKKIIYPGNHITFCAPSTTLKNVAEKNIPKKFLLCVYYRRQTHTTECNLNCIEHTLHNYFNLHPLHQCPKCVRMYSLPCKLHTMKILISYFMFCVRNRLNHPRRVLFWNL